MAIEINYKDPFVIFKTKDNVNVNSDLTKIYMLIEEHIQRGFSSFAFGFAQNTFLYSNEIAQLISCVELTKAHHCSVVFIDINNEFSDLISIIDFEGDITTCKSEQDLMPNF